MPDQNDGRRQDQDPDTMTKERSKGEDNPTGPRVSGINKMTKIIKTILRSNRETRILTGKMKKWIVKVRIKHKTIPRRAQAADNSV